MRHIKTRITNLKNRVNEILPEEKDILGFSGISKNLIIESLDNTYEILNLLTPFENSFEAILLQRRLSECIDYANEFLREKFKDQKPNEFNSFLNEVGVMHHSTKQAYILFTKEPIRLDIALNRAKEMLVQLNAQNSQIQPIVQNLQQTFDTSNAIAESLKKANTESENNLKEINNNHSHSLATKKKVDNASNSILKTEQEVSKIKNDLSSVQVQIEGLYKKMETTLEQLAKGKADFETSLNSLQASITQNDIHQKLIQETIENANRLGMAASFKRRKDELSKPYWVWGIATVITICVLIWSSYKVFSLLQKQPFTYDLLLVRIPIFASFVWLGWFCAKQFGFVSRIREDYSYKYAISMAFEGYKNASKEINNEMLQQLLSLTLHNISSNPLNIYESGTNHGTPLNEILSSWSKKFSNKKNSTPDTPNKNKVNEEYFAEDD